MLLSRSPRERVRRRMSAGYARLTPLLGDPSPSMCSSCCALLRALVAQCVGLCGWLCNWGMPPESPAQPWTSGVSIREVHHDDEQYADTSHQPPPEVASPSQRSGGDKKGEASFLLGSQKEKEASSHERVECPICLVRHTLGVGRDSHAC